MSDAPNPARRPQTILSRGGTERSPFGETSEAIFMTSGYVYKRAEDAERAFAAKPGSAYVYSRYALPTVAMFEERAAPGRRRGVRGPRQRHGGGVRRALFVKAGDRVVASRALFGSAITSSKNDLPGLWHRDRNGRWPRSRRLGKVLSAARKSCVRRKHVQPGDGNRRYRGSGEPPIAPAACCCRQCLRQPPLMKPLEARRRHRDLFRDQARPSLGGAKLVRRNGSTIISPISCVTRPVVPVQCRLLLERDETLDLRVERMSRSAARSLLSWKATPSAFSTGLCDLRSERWRHVSLRLLAFSVKGARKPRFAVLRAKLILISNNLGDARSLVTHPATTTHFRLIRGARA